VLSTSIITPISAALGPRSGVPVSVPSRDRPTHLGMLNSRLGSTSSRLSFQQAVSAVFPDEEIGIDAAGDSLESEAVCHLITRSGEHLPVPASVLLGVVP
jgi:hypothetical protein